MSVVFGRNASRCESECSGDDDERAVGACERVAEGFDGAAIGVGSALEVAGERGLVLEGEVDDAVGVGGCAAQGIGIVEAAALDRRAGGSAPSLRTTSSANAS